MDEKYIYTAGCNCNWQTTACTSNCKKHETIVRVLSQIPFKKGSGVYWNKRRIRWQKQDSGRNQTTILWTIKYPVFVSIKCKTRKKRRKRDDECSGVFLFYGLFFMLTKKSAVTGLFRALWYKKRRVLSVLKILERDQKFRIFGDFCKKCQKSDFPRKRSYFRKKSF